MSSFFEVLTETIGWFRIMISPTLLGVIIGGAVYFSMPGLAGILVGGGIAVLGLLIGILWATRVWQRQGTVHFLSRIIATPELDYDETKVAETKEEESKKA